MIRTDADIIEAIKIHDRPRVPTVSVEDRRSRVAEIMSTHGIDAVVVIHDEGLVGLVTPVVIVRSLATHTAPAPGPVP